MTCLPRPQDKAYLPSKISKKLIIFRLNFQPESVQLLNHEKPTHTNTYIDESAKLLDFNAKFAFESIVIDLAHKDARKFSKDEMSFLKTILVTGAGGFIGGVVARRLAREPDLAVRGGTRDGRPIGPGIESVRMDVCETSRMDEALHGTDTLVHCAVGGRSTTVDGTRLLLEAASRSGIRRVVHFSSIAVYGTASGVVKEASALVTAKGRGYAHWKVAAEEACRAAAHQRMDVVLLRPAIVYGPGSQQWVTRPARRLMGNVWGGLGTLGQGTCNLVHVGDVAEACLAAIRAPAFAGSEAFNISGPQTLSWNDWHERLAAALGCPPSREVSPAGWRRRMLLGLPFKVLARLLPAGGRLFERQILAAPAPSELTLFALAATYPTDKAAARLGWQPRIGLEEGLAGSVAWLRASGLVPAGHAA